MSSRKIFASNEAENLQNINVLACSTPGCEYPRKTKNHCRFCAKDNLDRLKPLMERTKRKRELGLCKVGACESPKTHGPHCRDHSPDPVKIEKTAYKKAMKIVRSIENENRKVEISERNDRIRKYLAGGVSRSEIARNENMTLSGLYHTIKRNNLQKDL